MTSKREKDDDYCSVIANGDGFRVIDDGWQWVLQARKGNEWRGFSFHLDRDALIERCKNTGDDNALQMLPVRYGEQVAQPRNEESAPELPQEDFGSVRPLPLYQWPEPPRTGLLPEGSYEVPFHIECYEDGFPKLPDCLDRRRAELDQAA